MTVFLPKGTHAVLTRNTREAGQSFASSPSSLFWGKLPTAIWFNLTDWPLSTGCSTCGWSCQWAGKGRGEHTQSLLTTPCCYMEVLSGVTEKFHLYPGNRVHGFEGHCQPEQEIPKPFKARDLSWAAHQLSDCATTRSWRC